MSHKPEPWGARSPCWATSPLRGLSRNVWRGWMAGARSLSGGCRSQSGQGLCGPRPPVGGIAASTCVTQATRATRSGLVGAALAGAVPDGTADVADEGDRERDPLVLDPVALRLADSSRRQTDRLVRGCATTRSGAAESHLAMLIRARSGRAASPSAGVSTAKASRRRRPGPRGYDAATRSTSAIVDTDVVLVLSSRRSRTATRRAAAASRHAFIREVFADSGCAGTVAAPCDRRRDCSKPRPGRPPSSRDLGRRALLRWIGATAASPRSRQPRIRRSLLYASIMCHPTARESG